MRRLKKIYFATHWFYDTGLEDPSNYVLPEHTVLYTVLTGTKSETVVQLEHITRKYHLSYYVLPTDPKLISCLMPI